MMNGVVRRRIHVTAISYEDVAGLLRRLELYDDVVKGKITCHICGKEVMLENIGGILAVNGKIVLICDKPDCIARAAVLSSKERQHVAGSDEDE
jgi:hypothetical protein